MSQEVKVIKYQALQYGKSYQQCLDIVKFVKQYSPDTKFELVSGASDFDRVKKELELAAEIERDFQLVRKQRDDARQRADGLTEKLAAQEREIDILRLYMSRETKAMADARLDAIKQEIKAEESK